MFEAQDDGAVVEDELATILKTALGVGELAVGDLFRAIDCQDKGKITYGRIYTYARNVETHVLVILHSVKMKGQNNNLL